MGKPRVVLDVDGVLADFVGGVLARAKEAGKVYHEKYVTDLDLPKALGDPEAYARCAKPGFCAALEWYPGARLFLRLLQQIAEVRIVTAPWRLVDTWIEERTAWLEPYIDKGRIFFAHDKSEFDADFMVEDSLYHLESWDKPGRTGLVIDRPWNQGDAYFERCKTLAQAFKKVQAYDG